MKLLRIKTVYGRFNAVVKDGTIDKADEIASWMKGRNLEDIYNWVKSMNAKVEVVNV